MQDRLRADIPAPPSHLANRPVHKGHVVPYFVAWLDGVPDFRIVDPVKYEMCRKFSFCWLCGKPLGAHRVFVIGPMCTVNRISSEPPSHRACAEYAAEACPHLAHSQAKRSKKRKPAGSKAPPGMPVFDNPGVVALWETSDYKFRREGDGYLVELGDPDDVSWWTEGRLAFRAEVIPAFEASVNRLKRLVAQHYQDSDPERDAEFLQLGRQTGAALHWLPRE